MFDIGSWVEDIYELKTWNQVMNSCLSAPRADQLRVVRRLMPNGKYETKYAFPGTDRPSQLLHVFSKDTVYAQRRDTNPEMISQFESHCRRVAEILYKASRGSMGGVAHLNTRSSTFDELVEKMRAEHSKKEEQKKQSPVANGVVISVGDVSSQLEAVMDMEMDGGAAADECQTPDGSQPHFDVASPFKLKST